MNPDKTATPVKDPVIPPAKEVTNYQLMLKLLELEKKLVSIEKKLTTPLIN
jgi:hypothetical protein